jgi:hypothetical protein
VVPERTSRRKSLRSSCRATLVADAREKIIAEGYQGNRPGSRRLRSGRVHAGSSNSSPVTG